MSVKIDYLNIREKDMTIFAEKKKKKKSAKKKRRKIDEHKLQTKLMYLVSESGARGWPLINVWGGMAGVFGY